MSTDTFHELKIYQNALLAEAPSRIAWGALSSQSVSVPCQNSGVGGSHGFFLPSLSHHLNEVQRSKPSRALQPPKQGTSLPPPSSLTLDSSCQCSFF